MQSEVNHLSVPFNDFILAAPQRPKSGSDRCLTSLTRSCTLPWKDATLRQLSTLPLTWHHFLKHSKHQCITVQVLPMAHVAIRCGSAMVYAVVILPTLLYASETSTICTKQLNQFHIGFLHCLLCVLWQDKISDTKDLIYTCTPYKLDWSCHWYVWWSHANTAVLCRTIPL